MIDWGKGIDLASNYQQHGDVILRDVSKVPPGCKEVNPVGGRYVLVEGEVTGHAHVVQAAPNVKLYEAPDGTLFLSVEGSATITHEEHAPQTISGTMQIDQVREVDPFEGIIRRVVD